METQDISNLLALCRTGTGEEKCGAIFTLAERGAREAIPVLLELTTSTDEAVRGNVAAALGKLGSCGTAAPTLIAFLDDASVLVRVTAIQLGALKDTAAMTPLLSALKASLLGALYQLGDEAVWARWLALVDEVDDQTACTILNGISYLVLPQHASLLRSKLEAIGRARPGLAAEAQSLLRRL